MKIRNFSILYLMILIFYQLNCTQNAIIKIDSLNPKSGKITPLLFGNFIEFGNDWINGDKGFWAQELIDRGFDMPDNISAGVSRKWNKYNLNNLQDSIQLLEGGYNPNGRFYQRLIKNSISSKIGIYQNVYVYDSLGNNFYIYLKSNNLKGSIKLLLNDTLNDITYFSAEIAGISNEWKRFEVKTPPISGTHRVKLIIAIEGTGTIDLDEASFMPENNYMGVKNEYYKMY